jgi:hypothetical protein
MGTVFVTGPSPGNLEKRIPEYEGAKNPSHSLVTEGIFALDVSARDAEIQSVQIRQH